MNYCSKTSILLGFLLISACNHNPESHARPSIPVATGADWLLQEPTHNSTNNPKYKSITVLIKDIHIYKNGTADLSNINTSKHVTLTNVADKKEINYDAFISSTSTTKGYTAIELKLEKELTSGEYKLATKSIKDQSLIDYQFFVSTENRPKLLTIQVYPEERQKKYREFNFSFSEKIEFTPTTFTSKSGSTFQIMSTSPSRQVTVGCYKCEGYLDINLSDLTSPISKKSILPPSSSIQGIELRPNHIRIDIQAQNIPFFDFTK